MFSFDSYKDLCDFLDAFGAEECRDAMTYHAKVMALGWNRPTFSSSLIRLVLTRKIQVEMCAS